MTARFCALALAAASIIAAAAGATSSATANSSSFGSDALPNHQWWEKVTVTVASENAQPTCIFSSSHQAAKECNIEAEAGALAGAGPEKGQMTKIVFERRFEPGTAEPKEAEIAAGEMLLGGQVLKLAIDAKGKVSGCHVVATAGDLKPDYGCDQAQSERFAASTGAGAANALAQSGHMTILIYAHSEDVA